MSIFHNIPEEYKPISPIGYIGYQLLFSIPIVGFIFLIIYACGGTRNINVKNFARSYFIVVIIAFILIFILTLIFGVTGTTNEIASFGIIQKVMFNM